MSLSQWLEIEEKAPVVSVNEHEEAESLRDLKHLDSLKGRFKGAKQVNFNPRKSVRRIYVNRLAIAHNMEYGTNYPTAVINDGSKEFLCHGVIMYGPAAMNFDPTNEEGKVSIETNAKIVAFVYEKDAEAYRLRGC